jgi:hypothetical protein
LRAVISPSPLRVLHVLLLVSNLTVNRWVTNQPITLSLLKVRYDPLQMFQRQRPDLQLVSMLGRQ